MLRQVDGLAAGYASAAHPRDAISVDQFWLMQLSGGDLDDLQEASAPMPV